MRTCGLVLWGMMLALPTARTLAEPQQDTPNIVVWDTVTPLGSSLDLRTKAHWLAVPSDVLKLESSYAAAASDPSYYGRAYTFKGDVVLEDPQLLMVLAANQARGTVYAKADGQEKFAFAPLSSTDRATRIEQCRLLQNTGDETSIEIRFSAQGTSENPSMVVSLGRSGIIAIQPAADIQGIRIYSSLAYGVAPQFMGDDLIFAPDHDTASDRLCVPCQNLFVGLLPGQADMLVMTWPPGGQTVTLTTDDAGQAQRQIACVDLAHDGKGLYLGLIHVPGVWHKEALQASYLEKDVTLTWKRPFTAKWKTQLLEGGVKTTFRFKEAKQKIWRGAVGSYDYPVWFDGDSAVYRLSKKIAPKGESLIYCTERAATPLSVCTPADIMLDSLGRGVCDAILDVPGRVLRTHHRRGEAGIRRACTCGCTAAIEEVFKAGQEVERRVYVEGAVDDMVYFVTRHVERIEEYQVFAKDMVAFLERHAAADRALETYVRPLIETTRELQAEYDRAREHMQTLAYTDQLARKTKALTRRQMPENLEACLALGRQWRAMGGAQDDVLAQSHRLVRRLFQEAGYGCGDNPQAAALAKEIMGLCRLCLRNPDGYEIWPDY